MITSAQDTKGIACQSNSQELRRSLQESWKFRVDGDFLNDLADTLMVFAERTKAYAEIRGTDLTEYFEICDTVHSLQKRDFLRYGDLMNPHILQGLQDIGLTLDCEANLQRPDAKTDPSEGRMEVFIRGIDLIAPEDYATRGGKSSEKIPLSFRSIIKDQMAYQKDPSLAVYLDDCEHSIVHSALYYVVFTYDTQDFLDQEQAIYLREYFRDTHANRLRRKLCEAVRPAIMEVVTELSTYTQSDLVPFLEQRAFYTDILNHFEDEYVSLTMALQANDVAAELEIKVMEEIYTQLYEVTSPNQLPDLLRKHIGNRHGLWE